MMDILLATIVGVFAVIFIVGIPITLLQLMFKGVFIDSEEDTYNINLNNDLDNGNN